MLKISKEQNDLTYKLKQLDIVLHPFVLNDQLEVINQRIVVFVNFKEENGKNNSIIFKSFSANFIELFKRGIEYKWISRESKWLQVLNIAFI